MKDVRCYSNRELRTEIYLLVNFLDVILAMFKDFVMPKMITGILREIKALRDEADRTNDGVKARAYLTEAFPFVERARRDFEAEFRGFIEKRIDHLSFLAGRHCFDADLALGRVRTIKKDIQALQARFKRGENLLQLGNGYREIEKKMHDVEELQAQRIMTRKWA